MSKPPTRSANPWPWIVLLAIAALWGWLLLRTGDAPAPGREAIAASQATQTPAIYVWTPTPTRTAIATATARVIVVTATASPTSVVPPCDQADSGEACVRYPPMQTPTVAPRCDRITPSPFTAQVCVKEDAGTGAKGEIQ